MWTHFPYQPSLFDPPTATLDESFGALRHIELDRESWVDHAPGWVSGPDALFLELLEGRDWGQRERWMYKRKVREPRLTDSWAASSGEPLRPAILERMRLVLSARYGVPFDSAGFNLYRDGKDGVAWHADRIEKEIERPVVALLSLGEPRKFLLRPTGGGTSRVFLAGRGDLLSRVFLAGRGDLLVMGGLAQRTWEHSVPKVARAGPRLTVAFRHGLDPRAYAGKRRVDGER